MTSKRRETPLDGEFGWMDPYRLFPNSHINFPYVNPSDLVRRYGLSLFDEMLRDDQIHAAVTFRRNAVTASGWKIDSPKEAPEDWEPALFIDWVFRRMPGTIASRVHDVMTAMEYGFSVLEKVWAEVDTPWGKRWVLADLRLLRPHTLQFSLDHFGNIVALYQQQARLEPLPIEKFVTFSHNGQFRNPYGRSDLEQAFRAWWLKDNVYKWLGVYLERMGIPPMFAFYNPGSLSPGATESLKRIFKSLQTATTGIIPRKDPMDVEIWQGQAAQGRQNNPFTGVLDQLNTDISRALLMPGLLGLTADQSAGSFARSQTHFDVFLMIVERYRQDIAESVIQEQIISDLMAFNYGRQNLPPPTFEWLPLMDDVRLDVLEGWTKALAGGAVRNGPDDEAHIRELMKFPEQQAEETPEEETPEEETPEEETPEEETPEEETKTVEERLDGLWMDFDVGGEDVLRDIAEEVVADYIQRNPSPRLTVTEVRVRERNGPWLARRRTAAMQQATAEDLGEPRLRTLAVIVDREARRAEAYLLPGLHATVDEDTMTRVHVVSLG